MYNTKKILITINGVPMQMLGAEAPTMAKSGPFSEPKFGINGDSHNLAHYDVYDILTLLLKYDSPGIAVLTDLARNRTEFAASYKDENTGEVFNTIKGVCSEIGDIQGDSDRTFTIQFLP